MFDWKKSVPLSSFDWIFSAVSSVGLAADAMKNSGGVGTFSPFAKTPYDLMSDAIFASPVESTSST